MIERKAIDPAELWHAAVDVNSDSRFPCIFPLASNICRLHLPDFNGSNIIHSCDHVAVFRYV